MKSVEFTLLSKLADDLQLGPLKIKGVRV
jgi:hypothetical protein